MLDSWNLMKNWDRVIPPSRPSVIQLRYLAGLFKQLDKKSPVAVLGSTMEFRDMLCEYGFENVYVFDRNLSFFEFTSKNRIYNNHENFIHGNWTETIIGFRNTFILILSDLTSGNVSYDKRDSFYQSIENSLLPFGHFYDKILTHPTFRPTVDLLKRYEGLPVNNTTVNYFNCEILFCSDLMAETELIDTTEIYKRLSAINSSQRLKKFADSCRDNITPEGFIWYYGKRWHLLQEKYCTGLSLVREVEDFKESPYRGFARIFHFEKKPHERN